MRSLQNPRPVQATSPVTTPATATATTQTAQWHPRWLAMTVTASAAPSATQTGDASAMQDGELVAPDHRFGGGPVPQYTVTPREREVLALLARRFTDAEIGEELSISTRTASHHVASILAKLGVANRRQAGAIAAKHGLH